MVESSNRHVIPERRGYGRDRVEPFVVVVDVSTGLEGRVVVR